MGNVERLRAEFRRNKPDDSATDSEPFSNQLSLETQLARLRTRAALLLQDLTDIPGRGNFPVFMNCVMPTERHVLATRTSVETGTILPADSITIVHWETADIERFGHWKGTMPIVVGKPKRRVPNPTIECLSDPSRSLDDLTFCEYRQPIYLDALPPSQIRELAMQYTSKTMEEDTFASLLNVPTYLERYRRHLISKSAQRNVDQRGTDRDDIISLVDTAMYDAIKRFASPERDRILRAGTLTTYMNLEVTRTVERKTAALANVSIRQGSLLRKIAATPGVDIHTDSVETIAAKVAEANPAAPPPTTSQVEAAVAVERAAYPMSLHHKVGGAEGGVAELGDLHGMEDSGYAEVEKHSGSEYEVLAHTVLHGSGVDDEPDTVAGLSRWFEHVVAPVMHGENVRARPYKKDLSDDALGWPTATYVLAPLLREGETWLQQGSIRRIVERLLTLVYRERGSNVERRDPSEVREAWNVYLTDSRGCRPERSSV